MERIELIYDKDCPHVKEARGALLQALSQTGMPAKWQEWNRGEADSPEYARAYGSPTILIDGKDILGEMPKSGANCCRLYPDEQGKIQGVPSITALRAAISSVGGRKRVVWKSSLAMLPGISLALLPKLTCPACWPAYAGVLSALGLGFINYTPYLLPLTVGFLLVAMLSLGYRSNYRRGYGPLAIGGIAGTIILIGKFAFDSEPALYIGIGLLMGASVWNAWPVKKPRDGACPACVSTTDQNPITLSNERR